jgi:predicted PurR-regulated permease PerM
VNHPEKEPHAPHGASAAVPASLSLRLLAAVAVGAALYLAQAALIPVALAVLVTLVLTTPVEALYRRGLPRTLSAALILFVFATAIAGSVNLLWVPVQNMWSEAPQTLRTIERKVRPAVTLMNRVSRLSDRASQIAAAPTAAEVAAATPTAEVRPAHADLAVAILNQTRAALVSIVAVIMLTLFLLAGGPPMLARMSTALVNDVRSTQALKLIDAVRREVGRYYGSIALINLSLGAATAVMLEAWGMPNPLLWGCVVTVLNFIPYAGSFTALLLLTLAAFVTFDTLGQVAGVAGCYLALSTIEGQLVQPLLVGRHLNLNPLVVFLALWIGGCTWGVAGILVAVPALVILKVVAEHSPHGQTLQQILGQSPPVKRSMAITTRARRAFKKQKVQVST